jgi:glycosyltransferase involved in cell wall biosynthesis
MKWLVVNEKNMGEQNASRTHVLEICRSLARADEVTLVSYSGPEDLPPGTNIRAVKFSPSHFRSSGLQNLLNTVRMYSFLKQLGRSYQPDVVYARALGFGFGPLLYARNIGVPAVLEINGAWREERKMAIQKFPALKRTLISMIHGVRNLLQDSEARLATHLVTVTENLSTYLQKLGIPAKKILVVSNGVNIEHFKPLDKAACRKELGWEQGLCTIGYVGGMTPWQGLDDLIDAFGKVLEHGRQARLVIVGDGPERSRLELLARPQIEAGSILFTGSQPYSLVPTIMCACDVLATPKKPLISGYSPLKLYEYLASGRPVFASKLDGLEVIAEAGAGVLFRANDQDDLVARLEAMLDMPSQELEEMGRRARQVAVERFSWDASSEKIRRFILENKSLS